MRLGNSAYTKAAVAKVFTSFVRVGISNLKDSRLAKGLAKGLKLWEII